MIFTSRASQYVDVTSILVARSPDRVPKFAYMSLMACTRAFIASES